MDLIIGVCMVVQILELDSAWRQRMQKEQVAHLAHSASSSQQQHHTRQQQLLQKERSAAKQVGPCTAAPAVTQALWLML